jgi:hypothetical protein
MKNRFIFLILCMFATPLKGQDVSFTNFRQQFLSLSANNQAFKVIGDSIKKSLNQKSSTGLKPKRHNPKLAILLSTAVPGAGQIYNQKYWKTPVIWVGMGVCAYFIRSNHLLYKDYKSALIQRADTSISIPDKYLDIYSTDQLLTLQDQYRQNRDLFIIATSLVYVLNIVDALVDAHLFSFDVSDDLSLNWQPFYSDNVNTSNYAGIRLQLNLK